MRIEKDQQHSDPDRIIQIKKDQQHSDLGQQMYKRASQVYLSPGYRLYSRAYIGQQHSDPDQGHQFNKMYYNQQHLDPDYKSFNKTTWMKLCCCLTEESTKVAPLNEFSIKTRLKRQPNFKYPK
jgi:hypothetical protein